MAEHSIENMVVVLDYIETHLTEKLDLNRVADAVHYSKYHLHHLFTSTFGFTPPPILDIALLAGYESQQAFTKAFTAMYKMPPGKYRDNEKFYPLQLKFDLEGNYKMLKEKENLPLHIIFAANEDIPCWMDLVRLVIDGFPYLREDEYMEVLKQRICTRQALLCKDGEVAIGIMLFTYETGSIDFMGVHPLYRKKGIPEAFLNFISENSLLAMKRSC